MTDKQFKLLLIGAIVGVGFMISLALAFNGRYQTVVSSEPKFGTSGYITDTWTGNSVWLLTTTKKEVKY